MVKITKTIKCGEFWGDTSFFIREGFEISICSHRNNWVKGKLESSGETLYFQLDESAMKMIN